MLSVNMDDVMQVVSNIQNYLIAFGVVVVVALVAMFAAKKLPKAKKKMVRAQSGVAILLALVIVVNLICIGPMSTMLDLVSGEGSISEETSAEATELVNEITQEGIVLAQNDDNILPVASGSKLNVFGWASTSPCYGGTGSGALNDAYPVTDLLTGLHDAGIDTNDLVGTDHCPGFGSAAKYLAATFAELERDCHVYEKKAVTIVEVMGRNAGWLTAASALSRVNGGEGPNLIYLCEPAFDTEQFLKDVQEKLEQKDSVLVAISEGIHDSEGRYVSEQVQSDAQDQFGHSYIAGSAKVLEELVRDRIGCKVSIESFPPI